MTSEMIIGLIAYAFASSITPGPNNLMLMASGANFGWARTIPHALGVALGFVIMCIAIGIALVPVFEAFPVIYTVMKVASVAFLIWLAWKIANAAPPADAPENAKPLTFLQAAAFQWVNPKAVGMAITTITAYTYENSALAVILAACIFGMVNLPSVSTWVLIGTQLKRVLTNHARLRAFNWTCAALLLATIYPIVMS
ncbi:MAG: threonine/homoserine/homoserine lactone efflux protein [Sulfitobacter sp.]|jgi:threonine/homoserine/homoserine lactone efflux protein